MPYRDEAILLLEPHPYPRNEYAAQLTGLGYEKLLYSDYAGGVPFDAAGVLRLDAVVGVWNDGTVAADRFARAVSSAAAAATAQGALIISPFATAENARLLGRSGARTWLLPPVADAELDARIQLLIHGERRREVKPVVIERRRGSLFDFPTFPMPA